MIQVYDTGSRRETEGGGGDGWMGRLFFLFCVFSVFHVCVRLCSLCTARPPSVVLAAIGWQAALSRIHRLYNSSTKVGGIYTCPLFRFLFFPARDYGRAPPGVARR